MKAPFKNPSLGHHDPKAPKKLKYDMSKTSIKGVKKIKGTPASNIMKGIGTKKKGK